VLAPLRAGAGELVSSIIAFSIESFASAGAGRRSAGTVRAIASHTLAREHVLWQPTSMPMENEAILEECS